MNGLRIETGWPPTPLSPNARPHWAQKRRAERAARKEAFYSAFATAPGGWARGTGAERFTIRIDARPATNRDRDKDNLVAACKPFIDGIAAALGVNDSRFEAPSVDWGEPHKGGRLYFEIEPKP